MINRFGNYVFYAIALSLVTLSLASDIIVLYSEDKYSLKVGYGIVSSSKTLKLNFYEDCIDRKMSGCTNKNKGNQKYLNYFSASEKLECVNFKQETETMNDILQFCVDMENTSWFGGAEVTYQYWPLNKLNWTDNSYVTKESDSQAVVESYFFNSDGYYIHIDESVALFVDINGPRPGQMCFAAKVVDPYRKTKNAMQFQACWYGDPRKAHENAIKDFLGMPNSIPDPYVVKYPIWSTWAKYKTEVRTANVLTYAREIVDNGFPRGTIEIDDNWETCYGNREFNRSRFENVKELVDQLKLLGFHVSLWTHPFVNLNCDQHKIGSAKNYFVTSMTNGINSTWWNGNASYVDFTNPEAAAWWSNGLRDLLAETGIDTFKFDGGESSWSPDLPVFHDKNLTYYPDNIVNAFLETVTAFGDGIEYRASRRSQKFGRFLRMIDRESRWDYKLGLPTLITSLIHLNMVGYPFVLPDMVGGNGYANSPPSKEMYIRWMEANVFMPTVQFSYTPWDFDKETVNICRHFMDLRNNYTDTIIQLMRNTVAKGSPVNPPIWWIDPTDTVAHKIDDEFLLGNNILVAPVVVEGATSRDIYLPKGLWRDENNPGSLLIHGRKWLHNYPAAIDVLPWFTKVGDSESSKSTSISSCTTLILALIIVLYGY